MANFISDFFENRGWLGLVQQNPTTGALEVNGAPVTGATEYTLTQFLQLDPADYNGYTVRVTDVDAPHATAGGVLARCDDSVWTWLQTPTFTAATVPTAAEASGWRIFVSDIGVRGSYWYSNGTRFNLDQESVVLSQPITSPVVLAHSPLTDYICAKQYAIPTLDGKSIWGDGDMLEIHQVANKTGELDVLNNTIYLGKAAISADATDTNTIVTGTAHTTASTNNGIGIQQRLLRKSSTAVKVMSPNLATGLTGASTSTDAADTTVTSLDTGQWYIDATLRLSTSTGDSALTLTTHSIRLISSGAV